jgi:hypothetical protein
MRRRLAWLVLVAVTLPLPACGGCGKYRPLGPPPEYEEPKDPGPWPPASSAAPAPPPTPSPSPLDDAGASSLDAAVLDAAPLPPPPPASTGLLDPAFLPVVDGCKKDDDCAVNSLVLTKDVSFLCCGGCTPMAASKSWVTKAQKTCEQKIKAGLKQICPPWDCAAPPSAVCVSGKCQLKPR